MNNDELPDDPITSAQEAAHQIHEIYLGYVGAGFTETQAFELIKAIVQAQVHNVRRTNE